MLPLLLRNILEAAIAREDRQRADREGNLAEASVACLETLGRRMPWPQYLQVLQQLLKQLSLQLTNTKRAKRLALATLLQSLRALLEPGGSEQPPTADAVGQLTPATHQPAASTPLSLQVRRMGPAAAATRPRGTNFSDLRDV